MSSSRSQLRRGSARFANDTSVVSVHGEVWEDLIVLFNDQPCIVSFGSSIRDVRGQLEWLDVEWEPGDRRAAIRFIGKVRPATGTGLVVDTDDREYYLRIVVTDVAELASPWKHFRGVEPAEVAPRVSQVAVHRARLSSARRDTNLGRGLGDPVADTRAASAHPLSAHLQLVAGIRWDENAVAPGRRESATLSGVGVAVRRDVSELLSIDADGFLARTGEAGFLGVGWDGRTGDLLQSSQLVRLELGARLRFGGGLVPSLRVGVGLEAARSEFRFANAGAIGPGPSPVFRWGFLLSLTAGIGERVLVGAGMSAASVGSVTGRMHVGYRP